MPLRIQIGIRVTPERDRELRELAAELGLSLNALINQLLAYALVARKESPK